MSYSTPVAVLLTVLFACTAVGYLLLAVRHRADRAAGLGDLLHVMMSVAMLAMPWSWGSQVAPPMVQIIVFSLATIYFVVLLVGSDRVTGHLCHGGGLQRRRLLGYHVVMMAAMVVMGLMMRDMDSSSGSDHAMPGMSMGSSSMSGMSMGMATGWVVTSWVLVAVFAGGTWMLAARWARSAQRRTAAPTVEASLLVLMSAGMAVAFVPTW